MSRDGLLSLVSEAADLHSVSFSVIAGLFVLIASLKPASLRIPLHAKDIKINSNSVLPAFWCREVVLL